MCVSRACIVQSAWLSDRLWRHLPKAWPNLRHTLWQYACRLRACLLSVDLKETDGRQRAL